MDVCLKMYLVPSSLFAFYHAGAEWLCSICSDVLAYQVWIQEQWKYMVTEESLWNCEPKESLLFETVCLGYFYVQLQQWKVTNTPTMGIFHLNPLSLWWALNKHMPEPLTAMIIF